MTVHFCIYSIDATDLLDPTTASDYTYFYANPRYGTYDPDYGRVGRGTDLPVLDGVVHQDFGIDAQDRKIRITDDNAMPQAVKEAIEAKESQKDTEWYFTDGIDVYRVQFSRNPRGFKTTRNMALWDEYLQGRKTAEEACWYNYEIILNVLEVITEESSGESS